MTNTPQFAPERFDALAQQLTARIRSVVPVATLHISHETDAYCCASWRLKGCAERELFVEQPGSAIAPSVLRVGIYFQDAPSVTAQPGLSRAAFESLAKHRAVLQGLGVSCTFTPGSKTRDDAVFSWSDGDLSEWFTGPSDNRDLVWLWDLRKGEPSVPLLEDVVGALLPVWLAWNSL